MQRFSVVQVEQFRVVAAMYVGYAAFMVLRMIPTAVGGPIRDDPSLQITLGDWGEILATGTAGAVLGKFLGGYAADRWGGRRTFASGLLVASIAIAIFACATSQRMFQAAFFFALMAKSFGWPAMTRIILTWFAARQYGRVWGVISTSSRVGTLVATLLFGSLLAVLSWRQTLALAALLGGLASVAFWRTLREAPSVLLIDEAAPERPGASQTSAPVHPLQATTLPAALCYFARSRRFWLIVASLTALTILWDFLLLVPMFLQDRLGLAAPQASRAAAAFPLGSLVSVLVGGYMFDRLSRRATAWTMGAMLLLATGCLACFLAMPHWNLSSSAAHGASLALLLVLGLCLSPCYYLPMSIFSMEFGGPHSGFLVALLDALAFGANAVFYYYGGGVAERSWELFLSILIGIAAFSAGATWLFLMGESRAGAAAD